MALKEPLRRVRIPKIRTLADVESVLQDLQHFLELQRYYLEQQAPNEQHDSGSLQGVDVSSTAPASGQVLGYDNAASEWEPKSVLEGEGIDVTAGDGDITVAAEDAAAANKGILQLAGDLTGTAASPKVAGIRGRSVENVAPIDGEILRWNTAAAQWQPDGEEKFWSANDLTPSSGATVVAGWSTASSIFSRLPQAADERCMAGIMVPRSWSGKNLTLEYLIGGDGTAGNCRTYWGIDDGNLDNTTVTGVTSTLTAFGVVTVVASTTISLAGTQGRRATLAVGRDPGHVDDDISTDDIRLYGIRLYRTP